MEKGELLENFRRRISLIESELDGLKSIVDELEKLEAQKIENLSPVEEPVVEPVVEPSPAQVPESEPVIESVVEPELVAEPERPAAPEVHKPKVDARLISDLRKAIGLNDKIRFQKELFGGDAAKMWETVDILNAMPSYIEALEYLAANFSWNDEDETVKYFKDILSRKSY